jgi:hypothetical protein
MPKGIPNEKPKGNAQWRPANRLGTQEKRDGFSYRFVRNEAENIESKSMEGWKIVNKTTGIPGEIDDEQNKTSGAKQHKELVLMALPEETVKARTEYYTDKTNLTERALKKNLQSDLSQGGGRAVADGSIIIQ